ncbi:MAG: hypothetical protein ABL868_00705 [Sulfuriferula sp.]
MSYLVYLSAVGVRIMRQSGKRTELIAEADAAGATAVLAQLPRQAQVRLLIDSADDTYQTQTLPHVTGRAQRQMLARQAQILTSPYTAVQWQTRLRDGRRDDVYLFAAIQESDWLRASLLALQHTHIVNMSSVAILVQQLARAAAMTALWITRGQAGIRCTYVANGQLLFTRLLQADADVTAEISNTQQYLISHQVLSASAVLSVHYVAGVLQPIDLAQVQWLAQQADDYLQQLARTPQLLNFAPPALLRAHQQARWQHGLLVSAVSMIALGSLVLGYLYLQNQQRTQQLQALLRTPLPGVMPMAIADQQATVNLFQQLRHAPEPITDLAWLSELLMRHPRLQIQHLVWRADTAGVLVINGTAQAGDAAQADDTAQANDAALAMHEVENFMAALRSDARVLAVHAQHLPINRDPHLPVHGGAVQDVAKFALSVSLRGER